MYDLATLEDTLAADEAQVPKLRDGCAKTVTWADQAGLQTDIAVVFVHGFSASRGELSPLPEMVAESLGANLFATRLMGHGQDGSAMGEATLAGWRLDMVEAIEIGKALGKRVLVIGCSTGCTLTTLGLTNGDFADDDIMGVCFVSPNFGLRHQAAQLVLDLPMSERWVPYIIGRERSFDVVSPAHAQFWTTRYPTKALKPMGDAIRAVMRADLSQITTPMMIAVNANDQVINPARAEKVLRRWGGPTLAHQLVQTADDDSHGHIMAGDVFSPNQTGPLSAAIVEWAQTL